MHIIVHISYFYYTVDRHILLVNACFMVGACLVLVTGMLSQTKLKNVSGPPALSIFCEVIRHRQTDRKTSNNEETL